MPAAGEETKDRKSKEAEGVAALLEAKKRKAGKVRKQWGVIALLEAKKRKAGKVRKQWGLIARRRRRSERLEKKASSGAWLPCRRRRNERPEKQGSRGAWLPAASEETKDRKSKEAVGRGCPAASEETKDRKSKEAAGRDCPAGSEEAKGRKSKEAVGRDCPPQAKKRKAGKARKQWGVAALPQAKKRKAGKARKQWGVIARRRRRNKRPEKQESSGRGCPAASEEAKGRKSKEAAGVAALLEAKKRKAGKEIKQWGMVARRRRGDNIMGTIAAIATAQAAGGIGIIRISGENAISIAGQVFHAADGTSLTQVKGYQAKYGFLYDGDQKLDEVVALVFRAPQSYTGEDVVELSCHGGLCILKNALKAVFHAGAQPAQAGEFTKRAFINGKLDLTQAEAVMKLIGAQGEQAARAALAAHDGALKQKIGEIKMHLLFCASHMAAWVDYPDEEIPELSDEALQGTLGQAKQELEALIAGFGQGQAVMEGVDTVIAGRPNAGKSSLMNLLAGKERSIVTDIAGTTRDVVEETIHLGNLVLRLADTAGLRQSEDAIEAIGITMARDRAQKAGLILAVFDASEPWNKEDEELLELCRNRPAVAILNKTDLTSRKDPDRLTKALPHVVECSAATGEGLEALKLQVEQVVGTQEFDPSLPLLMGERQRKCCEDALECVREAEQAIESGMTMDAINVSIDGAIDALLQMTGEKAMDAVVDEVFSQFCVGK